MVGRLAAEVLRGVGPRRRDGRDRGRRVGLGDGRGALEETATPVAVTVVPLCGGYWSTGPEREPYRRVAEALDGQARGLMAPGLVDDAATQRSLVAHAGVRSIVDLWDRLDVALFGIGGPAWSAAQLGAESIAPSRPPTRSARSWSRRSISTGRFVCPALRERVIAFDARGLGRRPGLDRRGRRRGQGPADPWRSASRRRPDARDGRRDGRGGGRARRSHAVVGAAGRTNAMTARERAILGLDLGTTEVKAGLVGLDGRLLGLARSGYGLDVSGGHGWAEQDPGGWWSAVVSAVRALRSADTVEIVAIGVDGHGPTLVAVDARGEATRPAITFLDTRATAEADELTAATGVRGWSLGGLPAALWVERHEPAVAAATCWYLSTWEWLALRLTGVAAASLVPDQVVADPAPGRGRRHPARSAAAARGDGRRRRRPDRDGRRRARPAARDAGRRRDRRRLRELSRGRPARARRRLRPGRLGRWLRRLLGSTARGARRVRDAGAAGRTVQRRGRDGRDRPGARLVPRCDPRRHDHDRGAPGRGRRDAARRRRPRLPAVSRRRALADLGSRRARRARRPDPRARPRARRAGDRRGLGAGDPPRRDADARGRRPGHRDAGLRRPGPERVLERGQGRRDRLPGPRAGRARDRGPRLGDRRGGRDRRAAGPAGGDRGDDPRRPSGSSRGASWPPSTTGCSRRTSRSIRRRRRSSDRSADRA